VRKKSILYNILTALFILFFTFACYNTPPASQEKTLNHSATNRENNPPDHKALNDLDNAVANARTARQRAIDINVPVHYPMDWTAITTHFVVTEKQIMTSTLRETQETTARYYAMTKAFEAVNLKTLVMYANLQEQAETDNNILSRYTDEISKAVERTAAFSMPKNNEAVDSDLSVFHQEEADVTTVPAPSPKNATPVAAPVVAQKASETPVPLPQQSAVPVAAPAVAQKASETPALQPQQSAAPVAAPVVAQKASDAPTAPLPQQSAASVAAPAVAQKANETSAASQPQQSAAPVAAPAVAQKAIETPTAPLPQQSAAPVAPPAVAQKAIEAPIAPQVQSDTAVVVNEAVNEIPLLHEELPVVEKVAVNNSLLNTEPEQVKRNNTILSKFFIITFSCIAAGCCILFTLKKRKSLYHK